MQWSFSNNGSALQLLSFQEDKPKTGFESLKSSGLVTITTKEAFEYAQKNMVPERQGGVRYSVPTYTTKHTTAKQTSTAVSPSFVRQNRVGSVSPQPINTVPSINPMTSSSPVVGSTELRNGPKMSSPDLLTIFYNGSVCVFDVSPEKAQAIMLLAGNGPPTTSTTSPQSLPRSSVLDGFALSHPYSTTCLSPVPIRSITVSHSAGHSGNKSSVKTVENLESSNKPEPIRAIYPLRYVPSTSMPSGTVPQFRRKSLARFLEKRKDRVISTSPYS